MAMSATTTSLASLTEGIPSLEGLVLRGEARPRVEGGVRCDMFSTNTSVLTLAQWCSEKGRGVFSDNRAEDYEVWLATLLYYVASSVLLVTRTGMRLSNP